MQGENIGSVFLRDTTLGVVLLAAFVTGLTQGWHGLHMHETGKCEPDQAFKTAGGHLTGGKNHSSVEGGPHSGDLPNQMMQAGGVLTAEVFARLDAGVQRLLEGDGRASIIHSNQDDYTSQPGGDAGDRMACGVFKRPE